MTATTLDTLAVVKQLKAAGFNDDQAEAVTKVVREVQEIELSKLATKADVAALKSDLVSMKTALKADLAETKAEIVEWMFSTNAVQTFAMLGTAIALTRVGSR